MTRAKALAPGRLVAGAERSGGGWPKHTGTDNVTLQTRANEEKIGVAVRQAF